jgi:methionine biosynthesis protein MetW
MASAELAVAPCAEPCCEEQLRPDLQAVAALIQPGERVLDLGCGDGALLRCLIDTRSVTGRGVELTQAGVLACIRKGLSVRQGDLHEGLGDYPERSFDTVILSYTIPYLNDPAFVIHEMLRVGKRAVVSFPNWGHWRSRLEFLLGGRMPVAASLPQAWEAAPRARPFTIRDFTGFCQRNEFSIAQVVLLRDGQPISQAFAAELRATAAIYLLV